MKAPVLLELSQVSKVYGRGASTVRALNQVSFSIARGELVAFTGASGSGKSTCLNILGALDAPSSGRYALRGIDVARLNADARALLRRRAIGFVFQSFNLLARTSALENVELPLIYHRMPRRERRQRAARALAAVGLSDRLDHSPAELSGGQQQRVAVARALVTDPSIVLADEPTGNLDSVHSHDIMRLFRELNDSRDITLVIVTHEPDIAAYCHRELVFSDGRVARDGPPEGQGRMSA